MRTGSIGVRAGSRLNAGMVDLSLGLALLALVSGGCATAAGGAVGAGAGAAIGAGTGYGAGKGALIGTGVGVAAGAIYDIYKAKQ